jgi:hypothetical protein
MRSSRGGSRRTDAELLATEHVMWLLRAVAAGLVIRGGGGETSLFAPYMLHDVNVRFELVGLNRQDLIRMPISGPPTLAPRGERLLAMDR